MCKPARPYTHHPQHGKLTGNAVSPWAFQLQSGCRKISFPRAAQPATPRQRRYAAATYTGNRAKHSTTARAKTLLLAMLAGADAMTINSY
jgi:hypothetical protein